MIIATPGGATSNSYVTEAEADSYFAGRLNSDAWDDANADEKEAALLMATRRIEVERFLGVRMDSDQALSWPRFGVTYDDWLIPADEVPKQVKDAQCELALAMLQDDVVADTGLEGFREVKVGPIEVTVNESFRSSRLNTVARQFLSQLLLVPSGGGFRFERA